MFDLSEVAVAFREGKGHNIMNTFEFLHNYTKLTTLALKAYTGDNKKLFPVEDRTWDLCHSSLMLYSC